MVQLVRVVDSSNNEYCLEALSPTTPIHSLDRRQFNSDGTPSTALGEMMEFLQVRSLSTLSPMIRPTESGRPVSPSWVQVYRELVEWAILFAVLKKDFGTDTLIVSDGLLRSKVFAGDLLPRLLQGIQQRISHRWEGAGGGYIWLAWPNIASHYMVSACNGVGGCIADRFPGLSGSAPRDRREGICLV